MMPVLVTGAAGFIGYHAALALLTRGDEVVGVDNLNDYYDIQLKLDRLSQLQVFKNFSFHKCDISDREAVAPLALLNITHILHLAAQAGVRYSLQNPYAYVESNVMGQVVMLELARQYKQLKHFVYASSSSVYGGNTKTPFAIVDPVNDPVSLYAATKRSAELMSTTYSKLYNLPLTGLRFFTVYGPWGRPDMAAYLFVQKIIKNQPIQIYNNGSMRRDFTYIDDIVAGVLAVLDKDQIHNSQDPKPLLYNLGNAHPESLIDFISVIEKALGKKAHYEFLPMQPGDVVETAADITASTRDFGFKPTTSIEEGIGRFVEWYKNYNKI